MTQLRGLIEFSTIRDNLNFGILLLYKDCLSKEEETKLVNPSLWSEALESIILLLYRDCLNKVNESESESLVRISCVKKGFIEIKHGKRNESMISCLGYILSKNYFNPKNLRY